MAKKKLSKSKRLWIPALLLAAVGYAVYFYWKQANESSSKFVMYPGFDIEMPVGYAIHGIDVSSYQRRIYWQSVKNMQVQDVKIGFVFIKATEGISSTDAQFKTNWLQAKQRGITRGAYHYFIAAKDGRLQAKNFLKAVHLQPGDLPLVLDVEDLYGTPVNLLQQRVKDFLQTVQTATGVKPIIYSNADFYNRYLEGAFSSYPLWVAHYFEKKQPRVNSNWQFWQHNDGGNVNGIAGKVDFNVFSGDSVSFKALLVK